MNTAAISPMEYTQFFEQLMETGKNVIYTDMSRALSSSIQNVEVVAEEIREKYPNQKFYFLDSFCATGANGGPKMPHRRRFLSHHRRILLRHWRRQ